MEHGPTRSTGSARSPRRRLGASVAVAAALLATLAPNPASAQAPDDGKRVLVYTGTTGYRHAGSGTITNSTQAIHPTAIGSIQSQLAAGGIASDWEDCNGYAIPPATPTAGQCNHPDKNPRIFSPQNLARYDAIFFMNASSKWAGGNASQRQGVLFDTDQRNAIIQFVNAGGGIAANHNAVDMGAGQTTWSWWDGPGGYSAVGSLMPGHATTSATSNLAPFVREDPAHPSTATMELPWLVGDEHYNFSTNVRGAAHVLATFDESYPGYNPGRNAMGADHPISWCKPYDGGRIWLTGIGHFAIRYTEGTPASNNNLIKHLVGGVGWAAGAMGDADDCDYDDTLPPLTTPSVSPSSPDGTNGFYTATPEVALTAVDDSGQTAAAGITTEYRIGTSGTFAEYTTPFVVGGEGERIVQYRSVDAAGNVEATKELTLQVDTVVPTVGHSFQKDGAFTIDDGGAQLTLTADDATSGVASIEYSTDGGQTWTTYTGTVTFTKGGEFVRPNRYRHTVDFRATDLAGNVSDASSVTFEVIGAACPPQKQDPC
jgi:Trehalose utilisation